MSNWCSRSSGSLRKALTIEGARKFLETRGKPEPVSTTAKSSGSEEAQGDLFAPDPSPLLENVRKELRAIADMLK